MRDKTDENSLWIKTKMRIVISKKSKKSEAIVPESMEEQRMENWKFSNVLVHVFCRICKLMWIVDYTLFQ